MFEFLVPFMVLAPTAGQGTWSDTAPLNALSGGVSIHAEISGRPTADCHPPQIVLPPRRGNVLRFQQGGVSYEGNEAPTGNLVLRGKAARPVTLTGNRTVGGLWSVGTDGRCVGTWKPRA
jgi:hypothetical protein